MPPSCAFMGMGIVGACRSLPRKSEQLLDALPPSAQRGGAYGNYTWPTRSRGWAGVHGETAASRDCVTKLRYETASRVYVTNRYARKSTAGVGGSLMARRLGLTETNKVGNKQANWAWLGILNGFEV
jgi:hypothetical protein